MSIFQGLLIAGALVAVFTINAALAIAPSAQAQSNVAIPLVFIKAAEAR